MKRVPITQAIQKVIDNEHGSITFHFEDESVQQQPLNPKFFEDDKGKQLSLDKIAIKINEIAHDLRAKYYIVE